MLIPDGVRATIEAALEYYRLSHGRSVYDQVGNLVYRPDDEAYMQKVDLALAWLSAQEQPPVALDFPDGPGWWAGRANDLRQFTVWWTEFAIVGNELRVRWGDDDYTMTYELADFKRNYFRCKWYRLNMPWDDAPTLRRRPGGA